MENSRSPSIEIELKQLRIDYANRLPALLLQIAEIWRTLAIDWHVELATNLYHTLHNIAGSSGTFGASVLSKTARSLELELKQWLARSTVPSELEKTHFDEVYRRLIEQAQRWNPELTPYSTHENFFDLKPQTNDLIYVIENDSVLVEGLKLELEHHGYRVKTFNSVHAFHASAHPEKPAALIIDVVFPGNENAGLQLAGEIKQYWVPSPPIVLISIRNDVNARLQAVHVGVTRYFTKPIDFNKLRSTLDGLTGRNAIKPYNVLIVDDEIEVAKHHAKILSACGVEVNIITDPLKGLDALERLNPELVLMDVYMPNCSGLELAAMIRQDDSYAHMPIVFLSSETDIERQMAALNLGGDDFISKPAEPNHLNAAVLARLKRSRWIRRLNTDLRATLQESEFQRIALNQHSIVCVIDVHQKIVAVNQKFCDLSLYNRDELIGRDFSVLNFPEKQRHQLNAIWPILREGKVWHGEWNHRRKDGSQFWLDTTIVPFLDINELPYQYVIVSTDITGLKTLTEELALAKNEAEHANRAKSEFLSHMSHELRTPLNAILGFSQLFEIDADNPLNENQKENVAEIIKAGNHLLDLINEILDLSRIESGRIKLANSEVNLLEVARECAHFVVPFAKQHNVELVTPLSESSPVTVFGDRVRIKQIILNLLSNAIKYNRQNGSVSLTIEKTSQNFARVSVVDTGIGIDNLALHSIFQPFNRLGAEHSSIEGTGIGLTITKRLVDLMNGNIGVISAKNQGSTFWFELPVTCTQAQIV